MLNLSTTTFSLMPFGVLRESDDVDSKEDCGNRVVTGAEEQHHLKKKKEKDTQTNEKTKKSATQVAMTCIMWFLGMMT